MLFYFKGGFENAKKNQGALKVVSDCFLILRGAFKMPKKFRGALKMLLIFKGGSFIAMNYSGGHQN